MPLPTPPARKAAILDLAAYATQTSSDPSPRVPQRDAAVQAQAAASSASPGSWPSSRPISSSSRKASGPAAGASSRPEKALAGDAVAGQAALPAVTAQATLPSKAVKAQPTAGAAVRRRQRDPAMTKPRTPAGPPKLFVLDTNVLMHDPMSLFRFEEHDIFLPMITLEELDGHKKGMSEVARNARQVSRELDALATDGSLDPKEGIALAKSGHREASGRLFFQTTLVDIRLPAGLPQGKADNQILGVVQALRDAQPGRDVVLVSKDINMRVKARALGLPAEDYFNDKTLEDGDLLYTGVLHLPGDFWEKHGKTMESWQQGGHTLYRISGPLVPSLLINQFAYFEAPGATPLHARVIEITGKTAVLKTLRDYTHAKNAVWGVNARNREQNFALNLLMDPDCDFIT
ncbi:MAG: PIN domain-containing protein, partial [Betaproteobacteria bacterium]